MYFDYNFFNLGICEPFGNPIKAEQGRLLFSINRGCCFLASITSKTDMMDPQRYNFVKVLIIATTVYVSFGQECRYEFVIPEGNGVSCGSPDVGRIDSELNIARERANSVAATLGAEITKIESTATAVREELNVLSQDLSLLKTQIGKIDTEDQSYADMERTLIHMNETMYNDFKFLSKKIMDTSSSLQMQMTRQMDILSALAGEEASQRQLLDKQTILLQEVQRAPLLVQGLQTEVNALKTNVETNARKMNDVESEFRSTKVELKESGEKVNAQLANVNVKIDGLQSVLLGVDLKAVQNDIAALNQKSNSLYSKLAYQEQVLDGINPQRVSSKLAALEKEISSQRELVNGFVNRTLGSSPAGISQRLTSLEEAVKIDRDATKDMWTSLWNRLNGAIKTLGDLSRNVATLQKKWIWNNCAWN